MVAGDHQGGRGPLEGTGKQVGRLELTVARPLGQVARDDDGVGGEVRQELMQGPDLLEVGVDAEVKIREMQESEFAHQITLTRYRSTASPRAGTATRNRVRVELSLSGLTLLDSTDHSPPRSSITSIVTALSLALVRVTR